MSAATVAVLGCTSTAGKSLLTTALCRLLVRRGVSVAPFKAQNMSNNARVVDGGEIGVAQWLQARAAGVTADVRMNPVLLKPEADDRSQVVLRGRPAPAISATAWRERPPMLWPAMADALDSLRAEYDVVVIEGAGSPAEINLPDLVNNRVVEYADAAAMLVTDIDRGGAFAHLVGTHALVPQTTRSRLRGFVLNKFRGNAGLLAPGPDLVTERTGMAPLGVIPMLDHDVPDEEGATVRRCPSGDAPTVGVCRFRYGSNLDELQLLAQVAHVRYIEHPAALDGTDIVILPGSKHVAADANWLRHSGLGTAIVERARAGGRTIGICGGAQLLGHRIEDPSGVEGHGPTSTEGLGLLDVVTEMQPDKLAAPATVTVHGLDAPWAALNGVRAEGYEIRHGRVIPTGGDTVASGPVWARGSVIATTVHGLFEDPGVIEATLGARPRATTDDAIDALADAVEPHLDLLTIASWLGLDRSAAYE